MGHTSPHYQECPVTSRRKTIQVEGQVQVEGEVQVEGQVQVQVEGQVQEEEQVQGQEEEQVQGRRRGILLLQEEARRRRQLGRQRRLPHQEGQGAPRPLKALLERTQGPQGKDGPRRSRRGGDGPSPDLGSQAPRDRWLQPVDHHPTFFTFLLPPPPSLSFSLSLSPLLFLLLLIPIPLLLRV